MSRLSENRKLKELWQEAKTFVLEKGVNRGAGYAVFCIATLLGHWWYKASPK